METEDQPIPESSSSTAMKYGAYLGLSLIGVFSLTFLGGRFFSLSTILQYMVITLFVINGVKHQRDVVLDGFISYGKALKIGTLVAFYGSMILGFVLYVYGTLIYPPFMDMVYEEIKGRITPDQVASGMDITREMTPYVFALGVIFQYTLNGFVFSLLLSIFMKRNEEVNNQ